MSLILIIDSDASHVARVEQSLKGTAHRLLTAESQARGLELVRSGNPDLILIASSGDEAIKLISGLRKDPAARDTGIVLIDVMTPALVPRLKQLGVLGVISPDLDPGSLAKKVASALSIVEKTKLEHALKRTNHIQVTRKPGRVDLAVLSGIKEYALPEARVVLNPFFLKLIKHDLVVLDIRQVPSLSDAELRMVEQFVTVLGGPAVLVLAGKHLGMIVAQTELGTKNKVFFTSEELEAHVVKSKGKG